MAEGNLERLIRTPKQREFGWNFLQDTERLETWDELVVGEEYESEHTFEVTKEDMVMFAEAALDSNPIFHDENAAKASPYGRLMPHPIFLVEIAFWCIGKGRGNWIRTPGAKNPGQRIIWYEPFRAGDVITMTQRICDKWIRRRHCYVTNELHFYDQRRVKKASWFATLILPRTRADVQHFVQA